MTSPLGRELTLGQERQDQVHAAPDVDVDLVVGFGEVEAVV